MAPEQRTLEGRRAHGSGRGLPTARARSRRHLARDPALDVEKQGALTGIQRLDGLVHAEAFSFIGHTQCAGHPVSDDEHREHTREGTRALKAELGTSQPVHAILAVRGETDEDWGLELLETF